MEALRGGDGVASAAPGTAPTSEKIRVMVVDDSVVVRSLITRILESDTDVEVVASLTNGEQAVNMVTRHEPDIVVLDIEMPVMDGMTALPKLIEAMPNLKVLMASTLTLRNADISLKALAAGAADYVPKPEAKEDVAGSDEFKRELLSKVKGLGNINRSRRLAATRRSAKPSAGASTPARPAATTLQSPVSLRKVIVKRPTILAIGSSTGGPKALFAVMGALSSSFDLPIVITQHMPATFTTILAEHIASISKRSCVEGTDGCPVEKGHIYLAPGDYHMTVDRENGKTVIRLNQDRPENFCRPAVDPMLRSVVDVYGDKTLAVILTGMGHDGLKGCEAVVAAGGNVIAQDAETSVVWGMPGAVAEAGLCSAVLPLPKISEHVGKLAAGGVA